MSGSFVFSSVSLPVGRSGKVCGSIASPTLLDAQIEQDPHFIIKADACRAGGERLSGRLAGRFDARPAAVIERVGLPQPNARRTSRHGLSAGPVSRRSSDASFSLKGKTRV